MASVRKGEGGEARNRGSLKAVLKGLSRRQAAGDSERLRVLVQRTRAAVEGDSKGEAGRASMHFGLMANTRRV